jgi:hypothetical protein
MNLSDYTEEILIKNLIGTESLPSDFPPSSYYFTVFLERNNIKEITDGTIASGAIDPNNISAPVEPDVGPNNPGDGLWERLEVQNTLDNFEYNSQISSSINVVDFTFESADAEWGNVIGIGVFDQAIGGRCLYWMNLNEPVDIFTDDTFILKANSLTLKFD